MKGTTLVAIVALLCGCQGADVVNPSESRQVIQYVRHGEFVIPKTPGFIFPAELELMPVSDPIDDNAAERPLTVLSEDGTMIIEFFDSVINSEEPFKKVVNGRKYIVFQPNTSVQMYLFPSTVDDGTLIQTGMVRGLFHSMEFRITVKEHTESQYNSYHLPRPGHDLLVGVRQGG